jgi:hypothetical protein
MEVKMAKETKTTNSNKKGTKSSTNTTSKAKKEKELLEEVDLIDLILDENNTDPITLYDEEERAVKFEQVAVIPENDNLYIILKPLDELEGVEDDEAIVFKVDFDEDGNTLLVIEQDVSTAEKVFNSYHKLLDEASEPNA